MNILKRIRICGVMTLVVSLPCAARMAQPTAEQETAAAKASLAALSDAERAQLKTFSDRVKDYVKMQKNLPADRLSPTAKVEQLEQQRQALRDALQKARPNAKQGDIFTPEVAAVFRKLLKTTMTGPSGGKIRASLNHAEPRSTQDLKVNGVYPNLAGQPFQSMPPTLLLNLPVLPKGIDYCISGHTLALRDADANMVVDYLPDALP
ncbi:MAG TPA: hypothetical protein VHU44_04685 [Acidobacteriaceae bacterium]|jgi:hypothetical protein|nr:hypothetical protein [Acidobacteriaceae bacterium]